MAAQYWTAQLHIHAGLASEEAPEIAFAERSDEHGCLVALYLVAEPIRPGSERFLEEFVTRIGEEFLTAPGSLTGALQRAIRNRHDELRDWNRGSLPRDQACYGLSCLLARGGEVYLAQVGPSLAYIRSDDRVRVQQPLSDRAGHPVGLADVAAAEFTRLHLGEGDYALLVSSNARAALPQAALNALRDLPADAVLSALYPLLRTLSRVAALVITPLPGAAEQRSGFAPATHITGEAGVAAAGPVGAAPPAVSPEDADLPAEPEPAEEEDRYPERTPVGEALAAGVRSLFGAVGRLFRGRSPGPATEDEDAAVSPAAMTPPWTPAPPLSTPTPTLDLTMPDESPESWPVFTPPSAAGREESAPPGEAVAAMPEEPGDSIEPAAEVESLEPEHDAEGLLTLHAAEGEAADNFDDEDDEPVDDDPPGAPPSGLESDEAGGDFERESGEADAVDLPLDVPAPSRAREHHFAPAQAPLAGLELQVESWPANPFTPAPPPVLAPAADIDLAQTSGPLIGLRTTVPNLRRRERPPRDEGGQRPWHQSWTPIVAVLGLALLVLIGVAGGLLIPDLLRESERGRFDLLLDEAQLRNGEARLATDPAIVRSELQGALAAASEALALRPDNPDALAVQQDIESALSQVNVIVQPTDLTVVRDLRAEVSDDAPLSTVQVGGESAYLLDEGAGIIWAAPLDGGAPSILFRAGATYRVAGVFEGIAAAAPISMQWARTEGGDSLIVLDRNQQVYRIGAEGVVEALPLPNPEILGSADALSVHGGAIYLLDATGGTVWRYVTVTDGSLLPGAGVITRTALGSATDLAVDEAIYIASRDGRIRRFVAGAEQPFPMSGLDRPLLVPASLAVGQQSGWLYAADRGNHRVVIFSPDGKLLVQVRDAQLTNVRGVAVDEANGRLYYVTPTALLVSAIPPISG